MKYYWAITILYIVTIPLSGLAQNHPKAGVSIIQDHFSKFQIHENNYLGSTAYTLKASFYDPDYTRLEYSLHHTRGYGSSVAYSYGFSAAYVIRFTDQFYLKPGLGLDGYKMKERECKSVIRSIISTLFNTNDYCDDDVHASFNPFVEMELKVNESISIVAATNYRAMLSSTAVVEETVVENEHKGRVIQYQNKGTKHTFYKAGISFGMGLRINF